MTSSKAKLSHRKPLSGKGLRRFCDNCDTVLGVSYTSPWGVFYIRAHRCPMAITLPPPSTLFDKLIVKSCHSCHRCRKPLPDKGLRCDNFAFELVTPCHTLSRAISGHSGRDGGGVNRENVANFQPIEKLEFPTNRDGEKFPPYWVTVGAAEG